MNFFFTTERSPFRLEVGISERGLTMTVRTQEPIDLHVGRLHLKASAIAESGDAGLKFNIVARAIITDETSFFASLREQYPDGLIDSRIRVNHSHGPGAYAPPSIIQPSLMELFLKIKKITPLLVTESLVDLKFRKRTFLQIVRVTDSWIDMANLIIRMPNFAYSLEPRTFEEFVAGAYKRKGFNQVILTPRSGDGGQDVIAFNDGMFPQSISVSVKLHKQGKKFTHNTVRELIGVMEAFKMTNGHLVTTGIMPPRLLNNEVVGPYIDRRITILTLDVFRKWLIELLEANTQPPKP